MKKRLLSVLFTVAVMLSMVCVTASAEAVVKDVSEYGSSVYQNPAYWVPGSSGSNSVTWSQTGDQAETGTHVQTAVLKSGVSSVSAGEIAIGLGGNLGNIRLKNSDGLGARTFHTRFTFNSSTTPILYRIQYKNSSNQNTRKEVFTMSNDGVTYEDTTISVTAPYDINIFQNTDSGVTVIYVNDRVLLDQRETAQNLWASGASYWHQTQFVTTEKDSAFKLVIQNAHHDIYQKEVLLSDVIDYVMHKSQAQKTNYWWTINGIKTGWKEIQGAMDGLCLITGDNTNGYVLKPNSIDAKHYGFARYFLGSDDKDPLYQSSEDMILHQSFEYQPTNLTSGQIIEVRGNNGYQTLIRAVPATETEAAYLSLGGNKVKISSDKFYKIDFIVNNKDYEYYILVDGKVYVHDTIWETRRPLWQTVFSSYTTEESMTLRNMKTTVYNSTVDIYDIVSQTSNSVYVEAAGLLYDANTKELQVTGTMVGSVDALSATADIIYAAYNADGALVSVDYVETDNAYMNIADYDRTYPYGYLDLTDAAEGDVLTIKAYLWDSVSGMTPISNVGVVEYTVPVTATEDSSDTPAA